MLMCFGMAKAETESIEIGASGGISVLDRRVPTWTYFKYTLTQQIYKAYEIDFVGNISAVGFYNTSATTTRTIDLYLVIPNKTSFSSDTDWIPFTEADKMYSGDVTFTQNEWTKISFQNDKRLYRKGADNLAVIVVDRTGSYINASSFFMAYTADSQAMFVSSDDTQYSADGLNDRNGTILDAKNEIRLWGSDDAFTVGPSRSQFLPIDPEMDYSFSEQIGDFHQAGRRERCYKRLSIHHP